MKATILLTIDLDEDFIATEAVKRGKLTDVIASEILGDLECRVVDTCRWRDGVVRGSLRSEVKLLIGVTAS